GTQPYSYLWSPGGYTTQTVNNLAAGNYSVAIVDNNGCHVNASAIISSQPALLANISASANVSCYGGNNGSVTASVSGGTAPYAYIWTPSGGNSAVASGLTAGNYTVTVTDANNCTQTSNVNIIQPPFLNSPIVSTPVSCFGGSNGSATVAVSG